MARADRVVLSVTALGDLEGRAPVLRSGARPGDLVLLAGRVGESAAGCALLASGDAGLIEQFADLVAAHRAPSPPYESGPALSQLGATAMIDVSDGLSSELHHLAGASGVAIGVEDIVPSARLSAAASALGVDAREWVQHGGEDHALLATVPPEHASAAAAWTRCIGVVAAGAGVTMAGQPVAARGWDHFRGGA